MDTTIVVAIVAALVLFAGGVARLRVRLARLEARIADLEEHDELRWVGADDLPHLPLAHPASRAVLEHALAAAASRGGGAS